MKWDSNDIDFIKSQLKFCADYSLKGLDLQDSGMIWIERLNNVTGKNTQGTPTNKVVVRWC